MKQFSFRNTLSGLALLIAVDSGQAHTTNMTTVTLKLAETGTFDMTVEFDPGEKILGYPRYYEISRLPEPERNAALGAITQQIERELRLSFDGGRVLLQVTGWTLPNAPYETFVDTTTPTMSQIHIKGSAPARAERLDFMYTAAIQLPTPLLFRVDKAGEKLPMSRVVDGPDQPMKPVTLLKPPPPLLTDFELKVAARIVHAARVFGVAYQQGMVIDWSARLVTILLIAMLVARGCGRELLIAAAAVWASFLLWRMTGGIPWTSRLGAALLAGLTLLAGIAAGLHTRSRKLWWLIAMAGGVFLGMETSGWPAAANDPVLSPNEVTVLEGFAYAGVWLGFALVFYALTYRWRTVNVFTKRIAPTAGWLASVAGFYWVIALVRG